MEIEVGEFVRTKEGYIGKLVNKNEQWVNPLEIDIKREVRKDEFPKTHLYLDYNDIKKKKKNIIDLTEARRLCEW